jgi:hypothetical protein
MFRLWTPKGTQRKNKERYLYILRAQIYTCMVDVVFVGFRIADAVLTVAASIHIVPLAHAGLWQIFPSSADEMG